MKTILIIVLIVGIVLILTEKVFKKNLLAFKKQAKLVEKKANIKKYRKAMIGELPTKEQLKK